MDGPLNPVHPRTGCNPPHTKRGDGELGCPSGNQPGKLLQRLTVEPIGQYLENRSVGRSKSLKRARQQLELLPRIGIAERFKHRLEVADGFTIRELGCGIPDLSTIWDTENLIALPLLVDAGNAKTQQIGPTVRH